MHFSIPDTRELKDESGSTYGAYNIHVNGAFHCTVRYRQLHNLHDQMRREYGAQALPTFPPKKLLPLTPIQIEERRVLLEKYIQIVSQDAKIVNGDIFNGFLLNAQQETQNAKEEEVELDVYLMNWQKVNVTILSNASTTRVWEVLSKAINLPSDFISYFSLYLVEKEDNEISNIPRLSTLRLTDSSIMTMSQTTGRPLASFLSDAIVSVHLVHVERRMEDFEAPYLSLRMAGNKHYLVIRKSYWDSSYDDDVIEDRIALNLLYVQAVSDIERGWVLTNKETQRQMTALQARGSKREYLQLARTLKYYGYLQFQPCICDYPHPNTLATLSVGGRELNFRVQLSSDQVREFSFRVTRIRCWRITTSVQDKCANGNCSSDNLRLELSFEYLMSKDKLQWLTVCSSQAILMSVCLQGMVEELLMKKNGAKFRRFQEKGPRRGSWSYMKRDGSSHQICVSRSVSTDGIVNSVQQQKDENKSSIKSKDQMKKIAEKISSAKPSSKGGNASGRTLVENDAFECIGDDDL